MTRRAWARDQGVSLGCFWQPPKKWWFNGIEPTKNAGLMGFNYEKWWVV
jgi:hypothetical protein